MVDAKLREELRQKWPAQELPQAYSSCYLIYKYSYTQTPYVVGFDSLDSLSQTREFISQKAEWTEIADSYPFEIFKFWKSQSQKKPKQQTPL